MQTKILGSIMIATLAVAAVVTAKPAQADNGAIAAGIIGGVAVGAIVGSQMNRNYYGGPGYYESGYQPVYGRCHTERQQVEDGYGRIRIQRVRVCD